MSVGIDTRGRMSNDRLGMEVLLEVVVPLNKSLEMPGSIGVVPLLEDVGVDGGGEVRSDSWSDSSDADDSREFPRFSREATRCKLEVWSGAPS
jgi:hypothetical protein